MKKILTLLIFVAGMAAEGIAQRFIPKAGIVMPHITMDDQHINSYTKIGFNIGIGYEFPLLGQLYLQPEIGLLQKGSNFERKYSITSHKLTLYYAETAVPLKFKFDFKPFTFHILSGPTVAIGIDGRDQLYTRGRLTGSYKVNFTAYNNEESDFGYYAYVDRRLDVGLQAGIGIEIYNHVIIDFRYGQSLTDLYTNKNREDFDYSIISSARNRVIQFNIGIPLKYRAKAL